MELLVSVSAIAIIGTLIAQVFLTTTKVNRNSVTTQEIKQNGAFAIDTIERMVRNSRDWAYSCDIDASSTKSAAIVNPDLTVTTITCMSDGTAARIATVSASGSVFYITGNTMTLSNSGGTSCTDSSLTFSCAPLTGTGPLSIDFVLTAKGVGINPAKPDYLRFGTSVQSRNTQ